MRIHSVTLVDFFQYRDTTVNFPGDGLLVVTGANGAGKSTLIESVAWTLWGDTVRGSDPVPDGNVQVMLSVDDTATVVVGRTRNGRKSSSLALLDHVSGAKAVVDISGQTATETQAKINQRFGDWRRFCATRVFSRELLSRFGVATNKERQGLLEGILGLEQFSRAEKVCRAELSTRRSKAAELKASLNEAMAALARSREAGEAREPGRPVGAIEDEIDALARTGQARYDAEKDARGKLTRAQDIRGRTVRSVDERRDDAGRLEKQAAVVKAKIGGVSKLKDCPVCLRDVGQNDQRAIVQHFAAEAKELLARAKVLAEEADMVDADVRDQDETLRALTEAWEATRGPIEEYEATKVKLREELAVAKAQAAVGDRSAAMIARDEAAVESVATFLMVASTGVSVAEAALEALGPRGARVRLFEDALVGLQAETNAVLGRLGIPMSVKLSAKKLQASGREVDEVSMQVTITGNTDGATGYRDASTGERTRVDVALLLALSRTANQGGILFFDEIFDPLDDVGLERVADLLVEMSKDRQVVVTSHNDRLISLVPSSNVMRVEKVGGRSRIAN
jgi:DNA repair exonuclease SbcCD ATPase subunit